MKEKRIFERLRIKKCWEEPYLAYPQFDKYLTGGQLKVLNCLLRFATLYGKAFPSNARIAWESGLEKGTVANTKMQLVSLGVIQKERIKENGRGIWLYTIDTTWRKRQYVKEFDEEFNPAYAKRVRSTEERIQALSEALITAAPEDRAHLLEELKVATETLMRQDRDSAVAPSDAPPKQSKQKPLPTTPEGEKDAADEELMNYIVAEKTKHKDRNGYDLPSYKSKIKELVRTGKLETIGDYKANFAQVQNVKRAISQWLSEHNGSITVYGEKKRFSGEVIYENNEGRYYAFFGGTKVVVDNNEADLAWEEFISKAGDG